MTLTLNYAKAEKYPQLDIFGWVGWSRHKGCRRIVAFGARGAGHEYLFVVSHEQTIYRASGIKLFLCGHGKGRRDLSAEHSMRIFGLGALAHAVTVTVDGERAGDAAQDEVDILLKPFPDFRV